MSSLISLGLESRKNLSIKLIMIYYFMETRTISNRKISMVNMARSLTTMMSMEMRLNSLRHLRLLETPQWVILFPRNKLLCLPRKTFNQNRILHQPPVNGKDRTGARPREEM